MTPQHNYVGAVTSSAFVVYSDDVLSATYPRPNMVGAKAIGVAYVLAADGSFYHEGDPGLTTDVLKAASSSNGTSNFAWVVKAPVCPV